MLEQMILVTTFFPFPLVFSDRVLSTPLSVSAFCSARVAAPPYLVQCGSFNLHAPLFAARSQRLFMDVARKRVFRVRFEHKRLKTSQPLSLFFPIYRQRIHLAFCLEFVGTWNKLEAEFADTCRNKIRRFA